MTLNIEKVPTSGDIRDGAEAKAINLIIDYLQALQFVSANPELITMKEDGPTVVLNLSALKQILGLP